jgi:hypothetical protein
MRRKTCEEKELRNENKEKEKKHEDRGSSPKERDPFPLDNWLSLMSTLGD